MGARRTCRAPWACQWRFDCEAGIGGAADMSEPRKRDTGEAVEALDARMPFRFPRELIVVIIVFAVLWQIVSWFVPPFVIPGWERIFKSLLSLRYDFVLITLARVAAALLISFALGIVLSVAMYLWVPFENYCKPVVRLFMAVPVVCWILFSVLWFKWVEFRIAFVLVVVCAPVFIVDFLDGMKGVQQELRDMLRSFRPSRVQFFTKLLLPAIVPVILTSWKINLSLAIRVVTIAELVGAISGVGYGLVLAQELFSVADVFAWTLVLVVTLFLAEAVLSLIEARMLRWRT
jgi:NitT/TauT family transport system permease protein